MSPDIHEKQHSAGVRLLLGEHPPSRICKRGRINGGGGRCSRRNCRRSLRGRQCRKKRLAMSLRARSVTHLARPPTSRVLLVCSPHPTEKGRPTSLGREEGLATAVPGRREGEEREAEVVVVVGDKRRTETDPTSHFVTRDGSQPH